MLDRAERGDATFAQKPAGVRGDLSGLVKAYLLLSPSLDAASSKPVEATFISLLRRNAIAR